MLLADAPFSGFDNLATGFAAIIGALTFVVKVCQDRVAFRHKQAEGAKTLIADLYGAPSSMAALNMLDYDTFTYFDSSRGSETTLTIGEVVNGLRTTNLSQLSDDDVFVRKSFDDLFTKLEQIAGLLAIRYVQWSDIAALLGYYIKMVRTDGKLRPAVVKYSTTYGYPQSAKLIVDETRFNVG